MNEAERINDLLCKITILLIHQELKGMVGTEVYNTIPKFGVLSEVRK